MTTRDDPSSMAAMAELVCAANGIGMIELLGRGMRRRVSVPRQAFMAMALQSGRSSAQVGRFLGRDHSTVLYGAKAHEARHVAGLVDETGREV